MATRSRGETGDTKKPQGGSDDDLDAFFSEPPNSLTGQYWGPVESLAPVRLDDLAAPERAEPEPEPARRRLRRMDVIIGAAGVTALVLLVVFLTRGSAEPALPVARAATPPAAAARAAPEERLIQTPKAPRAPEAPTASPTDAPSSKSPEDPGSAPRSDPPSADTAAQPKPDPAPPAATTPPQAGAATSAAMAAPQAIAATSAAPDTSAPTHTTRKRKPKGPKEHTPPTASFPD